MDISSTTTATVNITESNTSSQTQWASNRDVSFEDEMKKASQPEESEVADEISEDKKSDSAKETGSDNNVKKQQTDENDSDAKIEQHNNTVDADKFDSERQQYSLTQNFVNDNIPTLEGQVSVSVDNNIQISQNILQNQQNMTQNSLQSDIKNFNQTNNIQVLLEANNQMANLTRMSNSFAPVKMDYTNVEMSFDDAKFFADLVQNTDKTLQSVIENLNSGIDQNVQKTSKNVKVSATLMNVLNDAVKTNQPVRINLDKDVSVVIKIDKDGALSATFIPGDKAVEEYLRQNISLLRQRFNEQELSYRDLSYSRQKQNQEQNRRNNKENDNE